jgi:DDE family transposase
VGQGILPFVFEATPQPMELTAHAGLPLVSETMLALGLDEVVEECLRLRTRARGYTEFDKVHAVVLVQAAGGECVEDVRVLARDAGLRRLIGRPGPSPDALHDFLAAFHDDSQMAQRPAVGAWIPAEPAAWQALAAVNTAVVQRAVAAIGATQATLDLDATVIESHKREALPHYQGGRGYQPTAVLWAEQDLVVADQYRDGNVPAGMHTREVAGRAVAVLPPAVQTRYFRGDSACYDEALLKYLVETDIAFSVSADMTKDLRRVCTHPAVRWASLEDRLTETVDLAEVVFAPGDWPKAAAPLRYIVLRFCAKQGQLFADDPKYLAVVSNRWDVAAAVLVRWHWEKAGTIEHTHDVTKNDLAAAAPPSGKFGANAAWYRLTLLTYNILTVLRRVALPARFREARPKRLRYELFTVPAAIRSHARQLTARLGAPPLTAEELITARGRLRDLRASRLRGRA